MKEDLEEPHLASIGKRPSQNAKDPFKRLKNFLHASFLSWRDTCESKTVNIHKHSDNVCRANAYNLLNLFIKYILIHFSTKMFSFTICTIYILSVLDHHM
ncbi:hypothetical protein HanXRQr2_Chr02g0048531 [Helianthus annuus]|uniref:Uncharacterized protein n=1 Tax=Helianthus annuus TaxID=4232 RepID=A0A9K3JKA0_HELAN|nr:hypothetical protein HanXRQr2_Chr02g0048531 [Helianthus annuus]